MTMHDRLWLCAAVAALAVARLMILLLPFRRLAPWLRRNGGDRRGAATPALIRRTRWAVMIAARNVPWNAVCLPQAIAAKMLLAARGVGSVLHLGVGRDSNGRLRAHAWLSCGDEIVIGGAGRKGMTPIGSFG